MKRLRTFGRFWWDFVIGDDWRAAAGIGLAIGATAALAKTGSLNAWWLMPVAVAAVLWFSLRRATR
jgi:O-antigen ligase